MSKSLTPGVLAQFDPQFALDLAGNECGYTNTNCGDFFNAGVQMFNSTELATWDITNPTAWDILNSNFTFEDNKLKVNGTSSAYIAKYNVFQIGMIYDIVVKVSNYSGDGSGLFIYDGNYAVLTIKGNGTYKYRQKTANTSLLVYGYINSIATIESISVRLVSNDTFIKTPHNWTSIGGASIQSSNDLTTVKYPLNFTSTIGWSIPANAAIISNGITLNNVAAGNLIYRLFPYLGTPLQGVMFRLSFTVQNYVSGTIRPVGSVFGSGNVNANGNYSFDVLCPVNNSFIGFYVATANTKLDIVNITMTPTFSKWDVDSGKVVQTVNGDANNCVTLPSSNFAPIEVGKKYCIDLSSVIAPNILSTLYSSNFGPSLDGWVGFNGTVEYNQTIGGETGCLKYTPNEVNAYHYIQKTVGQTSGKLYRRRFKYFIPDTNTVFEVIKPYVNASYAYENTYLAKSGVWEQYEDYSYAISPNSNRIYIYTRTLANASGNGESFYIKDFIVEEITSTNITVNIGSKTASYNIGCPAKYEKTVLRFQATANEVNQPIKVWADAPCTFYLQDVQLAQQYDYILNYKIKVSDLSSSRWIINQSATGTGQIGAASFLSAGIIVATYCDELSIRPLAQSPLLTLNKWTQVTVLFDTVNGATVYADGIPGTLVPMAANTGNMIYSTRPLWIGNYTTSTSIGIIGLIGEVQVIECDDVALVDFDPTKLVKKFPTTYPNGKLKSHWNWKGNDIATVLQDKAGDQHLIGYNLDMTDVVKI